MNDWQDIQDGFLSKEVVSELNEMTSDLFDIENLIEHAPEIQRAQQEGDMLEPFPQPYSDLYDALFVDMEDTKSANGFEYNTRNKARQQHILNNVSKEQKQVLENNLDELAQSDETEYEEEESEPSVSDAEFTSKKRQNRKNSQQSKIRKPHVNKRPLKPDEWLVNKRKQQRNSGLQYIGTGGKSVAAKHFVNKPCKCRMQCDSKFTEQERRMLFNTFWDLQDFNLQNISLHGMVRAVDVERHRGTSTVRPRFKTFQYYLQPNATADPQRVCKRFFLDTFQLSHGRVYRCCSKQELTAALDHRGNPGDDKEHRRLQKTHVQQHIEQFSMYKEQFLSASLTIRNMYDLYVEECKAQQQQPLSQAYYHQVLDTSLSVKLHKDGSSQQLRRKKKALLKRMYSREELVSMVGTLLRLRGKKPLQKAG